MHTKLPMKSWGCAEDKLADIPSQLDQAVLEQEDQEVAKSEDSADKLLQLLASAAAQPGAVVDMNATLEQAAAMVRAIQASTKGDKSLEP